MPTFRRPSNWTSAREARGNPPAPAAIRLRLDVPAGRHVRPRAIDQPGEFYTYDANGNRTNPGYVTGDHNRLLSDGIYDYEYYAEGNRTRRIEIATGAVTEYVWDHRNRLIAAGTDA